MVLLKCYYHISAILKLFVYRLIYGKSLKVGKRVTFRKGFSIMIEKGAYVEIGDGSFFNNYCSISAMGKIYIGKNCLFGESVKLYDHNHVFNRENVLIKNQGYSVGKIKIEDNCWLGSDVIVTKNVTIGENTVVAAGEIVRKDISKNMLYKSNCEEKLKYKENNSV